MSTSNTKELEVFEILLNLKNDENNQHSSSTSSVISWGAKRKRSDVVERNESGFLENNNQEPWSEYLQEYVKKLEQPNKVKQQLIRDCEKIVKIILPEKAKKEELVGGTKLKEEESEMEVGGFITAQNRRVLRMKILDKAFSNVSTNSQTK